MTSDPPASCELPAADPRYLHKIDGYYELPRREMLPFVPAGVKRLLDVGCGTGAFGAMVRQERGAEVWGVKLMPDEARRAADRLDRVLVGKVETLLDRLPAGSFDCVTFNDVLEHLPDPAGVLKAVLPLLREGGHVVVSVPNIRFWRALIHIVIERDFKYANYGVFDETHLRCFTQKSLARLLREAGLEVTTCRGINEASPRGIWFYTPYWVLTRGLRPVFGDARYVQIGAAARLTHAGEGD